MVRKSVDIEKKPLSRTLLACTLRRKDWVGSERGVRQLSIKPIGLPGPANGMFNYQNKHDWGTCVGVIEALVSHSDAKVRDESKSRNRSRRGFGLNRTTCLPLAYISKKSYSPS